MGFNRERLLEFLHDLDGMLPSPIEVILIGGSALNYLDLKDDTKDVDFFYSGMEIDDLYAITQELSKKYNSRIDFWTTEEMVLLKDGRINTQKLPTDYISMCFEAEEPLERIKLKILNPIDVVLTKEDRLSERDMDDITKLVNHYHIPRETLEERFKLYLAGYDGNKTKREVNFKEMISTIFGN